MKIEVKIHLQDGVLDPKGKSTKDALNSLGFSNIKDVKIGKSIILDINENNEDKAKKEAKKMCEKLLCNGVIEKYEIVL